MGGLDLLLVLPVRFSGDVVKFFVVSSEFVRDGSEIFGFVDFELEENDGLRLTPGALRPGVSCCGDVSLPLKLPFVAPLLVVGLVVVDLLLPKNPPFLVEKIPPWCCGPLDVFCMLTESVTQIQGTSSNYP